jgi:hypothetical protein
MATELVVPTYTVGRSCGRGRHSFVKTDFGRAICLTCGMEEPADKVISLIKGEYKCIRLSPIDLEQIEDIELELDSGQDEF